MGETIFLILVLAFALLFVIFTVGMAAASIRELIWKRKEYKRTGEKPKEHYLKLYAGLEIPTGTACTATTYSNRLLINVLNKEFELNFQKILSVNYTTDTEMVTNSSIVKGLAGAAAFGTAGAVIGSAPSSKSRNIGYCTILYKNTKEEEASIVFTDSRPNAGAALKLFGRIRPHIDTQTTKIEL